jgi:hypothetical protein
MSGDFDWHGDKDSDSIILSYQPPTAVYSTKAGGICVRQKADETEECDAQVLLTPQGALAVAWALIEQAHLVGLPEPSLSLMVEGPHWPPIIGRGDTEAPAPKPSPDKAGAGPLLAVMEGAEAPPVQRAAQ